MTRSSAPLVVTFAIGLALASPPAHATDVIEFYHSGLDHYFVTRDANEIRLLDNGTFRGWARTGQKFEVFDAGDPRLTGSIPVCRFYGNPARGLDSHFYSASPQECTAVRTKFPDAWLLESEDVFRVHPVDGATFSCPPSTKAVYRLYNQRSDVNHRYTIDHATADAMVAKGYVYEGVGTPRPIVFCAADFNLPAPSCSLSASNTSPPTGTTLTILATCSGSPTSYQWGNCNSATSTCVATEGTGGLRTYMLTASNASGSSQPVSISINWRAPSNGPPVCTLQASSSTPYVGSRLTLTANCTQVPTAYVWTDCSAATGNTCEVSSATTGLVTYSVQASNSFGASPVTSVSVNWRPPPPPGSDFCGSFAKVKREDLRWGGFIDTRDPGGGFEDDMVFVGRLEVPQNATGTSIPGVISIVEHVDPPTARIVSISKASCDFRGFTPNVFPTPDPTGTSGPLAWAFATYPSVQFKLPSMSGSALTLVPGEIYYVNIRNAEYSTGAVSCHTDECNVRVTVNTPR
ncbi:MAG TPA: hypothetical protein VNE58_03580 [Casimicrobiaceae bacterium]|nr:hypothetical protein [Casimicrobiaceae bacterium]